MIFSQLNEKMKAMDRSLLEKIAADIEMMDKEQGEASNINTNSYYILSIKAPLLTMILCGAKFQFQFQFHIF